MESHMLTRIESAHFGPSVDGWDPALLAAGLAFEDELIEGDFVYDAGFFVPSAFDGSSPQGDIVLAPNADAQGMFQETFGSAIDLTDADLQLSANEQAYAPADGSFARLCIDNESFASPIRLGGAVSLLAVASQDGKIGGDPLDSTVGEAWAWLLISRAQRR